MKEDIVDDDSLDEDMKVEKARDKRMWVDKYTSHKYIDLLTDEDINRNVLTWLKTWDELVFPANPKVNLRLPEDLLIKYNNKKTGFNLMQLPGVA
jgi:chromosome transmission fidelity protein 18